MRLSTALALCAAAGSACAARPRRDYEANDYYAVHLDSSTSPSALAAHLGLDYEGPLGNLPEHHIFISPKQDANIVGDAREELKRRRVKRELGSERHILDGVLLDQKQKLRKRLWKRDLPDVQLGPRQNTVNVNVDEAAVQEQLETAVNLKIHDPKWTEQWHLFNTLQVGNDLNVTGVWAQGITGQNASVCIVDDGLDMDSDDLAPNYFAAGSYDFNDQTDEPKPRLSDDRHGTRCAGEVAAAKNDACGVGVAWDARIAGIRILSKPISDADEAEAMVYGFQQNDIYSCSWGPPDDGKSMDAPGILIKRAMVNAVQNGRGGRGTIYVFAAGNGAAADDNCNFDGYTNSIYSITVGAIDKANLHPYYSEKCSAQLVVTYSSGSGDAIHTTDVGKEVCTAQHGGTSAAGPLGAGVYALVLSMRPDLTWRDLQWLQLLTAVKFTENSDWQTTALNKSYSHQYGYGRIDAGAMVEAAKDWKLVKPQAWYWSPWMHVRHAIPQGDQGLSSTFEVTEQMLKDANLESLEHVTVTMNVEHTRRGDLSCELRSPSGVVSHISTARKHDAAPYGYAGWTFMSVAHWGESGVGNWTVILKDTVVNEKTGTFVDWRLRLWGLSRDAAIQKLLPMPTEHDDDNHNGDLATAIVGTTSISIPNEAPPTGVPSDLPDRPINAKPTESPATAVSSIAVPSQTSAFAPPITATGSPTATTPADQEAEVSEPTASSSASDSFLPSPFPTFGVSKRTQIWIYGAVALILIFCTALVAYFVIARRRRLRQSPRDDYEFAVLDDEEDDAGAGGRKGMAGGRRKKRAGELYDAFAGESDEEVFSDDDELEHERYRDHDEEEPLNEKAARRGDE